MYMYLSLLCDISIVHVCVLSGHVHVDVCWIGEGGEGLSIVSEHGAVLCVFYMYIRVCVCVCECVSVCVCVCVSMSCVSGQVHFTEYQ